MTDKQTNKQKRVFFTCHCDPGLGCLSLSKSLVATVQLDHLGANEVKRQFPALDPGVQQLQAAEGRH